MDSNKLVMLMDGFNALLKAFQEPLFMAFTAMIAFSVAIAIKRVVLE